MSCVIWFAPLALWQSHVTTCVVIMQHAFVQFEQAAEQHESDSPSLCHWSVALWQLCDGSNDASKSPIETWRKIHILILPRSLRATVGFRNACCIWIWMLKLCAFALAFACTGSLNTQMQLRRQLEVSALDQISLPWDTLKTEFGWVSLMQHNWSSNFALKIWGYQKPGQIITLSWKLRPTTATTTTTTTPWMHIKLTHQK